jgi:hypothetical protein
MPTNLSDADTGGETLLFADQLVDTEFRLVETAVYDAEEVRDEIDQDIPKFGRWLPASIEGQDERAWLVGLGELIEELQRFEDPTAGSYEVTRCEKSGSGEQDPYEVNVEPVADADQTGLT